MQTFQPVYGIIIIYATSEAVVTDCLHCAAGACTPAGSQEKKRASVMRSKGISVRQKFVSALSARE